jgi:hypothetical protein
LYIQSGEPLATNILSDNNASESVAIEEGTPQISQNIQLNNNSNQLQSIQENITAINNDTNNINANILETQPVLVPQVTHKSINSQPMQQNINNILPSVSNSVHITRSGRQIRPNTRLQSLSSSIYSLSMKVYLSAYRTSITKALKSEHNKESYEAIKNEIDYMIKYKVMIPEMFENIPYQHRRNIIRSHMFLKWKYHPDGRFDKIKARLVGGGDMQNINTYDDTNSPTINSITVMTLLNIMTVLNLQHTVADISGAFLSAEVKPDDPVLYVIIPKDVTIIWTNIYPEYKKYVNNDGVICMKLLKYIYGLKQAARKFNDKIHEVFKSYGLQQSLSDSCLYYMECDEYLLIVAIHVDDLLILARTITAINLFIEYIKRIWDVNLQTNDEFSYLGLSIIRYRDKHITTVSQYKYFLDILDKWANIGQSIRTNPMNINYITSAQASDLCNKHDYLSLVMSLMYLARFTRPDILFSVTYLATKCDSPTLYDMNAAYHIIQYLRSTGNYAYRFSGYDIKLSVYIDASHGLHTDMKGHSAIIITLGTAPIMTRSAKQKIVALHSTDAEMIAMVDGLTYVIWIRLLLSELLFEIDKPIPVYQDNMSAILLYNGGGQFKRSKHMYIKQQYVKDLILRKIIDIKYLSGLEIPADPITKPVPSYQINRMLQLLHVVKI